MTNQNQFVLGVSLAIALSALFVLPAVAAPASVPGTQNNFSLVPCGGPNQQPCTFDDMLRTVVRLINYLIAIAGIVAAYHIVSSGWGMMSAMGNMEKITAARQGLTHAVIGFALVFLAFAMVNLVLGLLGITCQWWTGPYTNPLTDSSSSLRCLF